MANVRVGVIVLEGLGRLGIVVHEDSRPDDSWLAEQADEEMKNQPMSMRWWAVMPLTGGLLLVPESTLQVVRETTYEDFLVAVEHTEVEGRRSLGLLFPAYTEQAIAKAKRERTGA